MAAHLFIPAARLGSVLIKEICNFIDNGHCANVHNGYFHSEGGQETSVAYRDACVFFRMQGMGKKVRLFP